MDKASAAARVMVTFAKGRLGPLFNEVTTRVRQL